MTIRPATIVARTQTTMWVRIPSLHQHRIATLPSDAITGTVGETVDVDVLSDIVSREPDGPGWTVEIAHA